MLESALQNETHSEERWVSGKFAFRYVFRFFTWLCPSLIAPILEAAPVYRNVSRYFFKEFQLFVFPLISGSNESILY